MGKISRKSTCHTRAVRDGRKVRESGGGLQKWADLTPFPRGNARTPASRGHSSLGSLCFTLHFHPLPKVQSAVAPESPSLSHDPIAPGGALEGLSVQASWLTVAGGCTPSSSVPTRDRPRVARLGHHTGPHTHASQGDAVEPAFQAVAIVGAPLPRARPPVEDSLVVVEQLRVAQGVHVGACLQADAVRT